MDKNSTGINPNLPFWKGYRENLGLMLESWPVKGFPSPGSLNEWLPPGVANARGDPIRFVAADAIPGVQYERHIHETGQVSTRKDCWHDVFNALVWSRFPALKSALNACHYRELPANGSKRRSRLRDALTLLDESGAIVCSQSAELLHCLAHRDWRGAFQRYRCAWKDTRVMVCGHALLEKFPKPYKSMTAKAILLRDAGSLSEAEIDQRLAKKLLSGELFSDPTGLAPLPLMGIPGWWIAEDQDEIFYSDRRVFRSPPPDFVPPVTFKLT